MCLGWFFEASCRGGHVVGCQPCVYRALTVVIHALHSTRKPYSAGWLHETACHAHGGAARGRACGCCLHSWSQVALVA